MTTIPKKQQYPKPNTTAGATPTNLARALLHASFGWPVFPCQPPRPGDKDSGKRPLTTHGFKDATTDDKTIRQWWGKWPQANIGIRTGTTSDLVVIDADGPEGIASYKKLNLPATVTCETGNGRHYYFKAPKHVIPNSQSGAKLGTGIDVRGEGGYVIAPGSVHHTGVAYEWMDETAEVVDLPADAMEKIQALEAEKKGEQQAAKQPTAPAPIAPPATDPTETDSAAMARCWNYVQTMPEAISGSGGHDRAFAVACVLFRLTKNDNIARQLLDRFNNEKCQPPWTEKELDHKWEDAKATVEAAGELGSMDRPAPGKPVEPGHTPVQDAQADGSDDDALILNPGAPLPTAKKFHEKYYTATDGTQLLRHHDGEFLEYRDGCYRVTAGDGIRAKIYKFTEHAVYPVKVKNQIQHLPFNVNKTKAENIVDALKAHANLPSHISAPAWLDDRADYKASELLAHPAGILHLPTRTNLPASPQFFTRSALSYPYNPNAPQPVEWLAFLHSVWPDDPESISTLQEMFGYLMSEDTSQQKIFLIVGPKRSGKGTIGRVLSLLRGLENVAGIMLSSLATNFGLQPLIGQPVAIIADARLSGKTDQSTIAERLLSISGEDTLTIDRKYNSAHTGRLNTRFVVMTNELPRLNDASGALASRFIVVEMTRSFFGKEDHGLPARLAAELPGILNWSIDGYQRLTERGYFQQPTSAAAAIEELATLGSPIVAFVRDKCLVEPGRSVHIETLYATWREWCSDQGRDHPGIKQVFIRDLKAAVTGLKTVEKRHRSSRWREIEGICLTATR